MPVSNPLARRPRISMLLASVCFVALIAGVTSQFARYTPPAHAATTVDTPLRMISAPNANYSRGNGRKIDTVVVHYMSGINVAPSNWADPQVSLKILKQYRVSAHYVIDRAGTVYHLVDEKNVAWHAGGSIMPAPDNRRMVNRFSIGIELIGTQTSGFTDVQYQTLTALISRIKSRYPIRHLVGHDQIAGRRAVSLGLRKDMKPDPGSNFDWPRLRGMLAEME